MEFVEAKSIGEVRRHLKNDKLAVVFGAGFASLMLKAEDVLVIASVVKGQAEWVLKDEPFNYAMEKLESFSGTMGYPELVEDSKYNFEMHLRALESAKELL